MSNDKLREAARALMAAVECDEEQAGGMLGRDTLRLSSLLRIEIDAADRRDAAVGKALDEALGEGLPQ